MELVEIYERLKRAGWVQIGSGGFSKVYANPKQPDKVIKIGAYLTDLWPIYALWAAEKGWAGEYAPLVYSIKFYKNFYIAVSEKLEINYFALRFARCLLELDRPYTHGMNLFCNSAIETGWTSDLGQSNIMMRKGGLPVLNDPQLSKSSNYIFPTRISSWQRRRMLRSVANPITLQMAG